LKLVEKKENLPWYHSVPLTTSQDERKALKQLINEYRNNFAHFVPKSWTIYTDDFPIMFKHVMRVIQFLALESNTFFIHDDEYKECIQVTIASINRRLDLYIESHSSA
jgi:hypothetical protein